MPDKEMAEQMVKNHSITPMKINDSQLEMTNLERDISLIRKPLVRVYP